MVVFQRKLMGQGSISAYTGGHDMSSVFMRSWLLDMGIHEPRTIKKKKRNRNNVSPRVGDTKILANL